MATIKSIEEKAKAYDEAMKAAVVAHKDEDRHLKATLERIFPELKERDGERIRKEIRDFICWATDRGCITKEQVEKSNSWLAWLEKQGKDNMGISEATKKELEDNLNKALQKETPESWNEFLEKQGEQNPTDKIEPKFKVGDYVVGKYISGYVSEVRDDCYLLDYQGFPIDKQDNYHLWTIQDAKDGDVLVASDGSIFIFAGVVDCACKYYVALTTDNVIKVDNMSGRYWETSTAVHPATKEQRDALMKAMSDAGYTFDFEKKELKKIEQKSTYSEEEEKKQNYLIALLQNSTMNNPALRSVNEGLEEWLKSLKDRYTWKPSDEQMNTLEHYMHTLTCNEHKEILFGLYTDLKKLKGE